MAQAAVISGVSHGCRSAERFPHLRAECPTKGILDELAAELPTARQYTHTGEKN